MKLINRLRVPFGDGFLVYKFPPVEINEYILTDCTYFAGPNLDEPIDSNGKEVTFITEYSYAEVTTIESDFINKKLEHNELERNNQ